MNILHTIAALAHGWTDPIHLCLWSQPLAPCWDLDARDFASLGQSHWAIHVSAAESALAAIPLPSDAEAFRLD